MNSDSGKKGEAMSLTGDGAPRELREQANDEERTLNDELAEEAQRAALRTRSVLARSGTKHDPEL